ncbi:MAG: 3-hydroxyacyl-CoA dehydrogenase PaaC [Rhodocyclaceae bacterium]|nr:3-hydroxyacyl-CoA dehydrogenase PaaC [Rhodocyclaceae bacterium]
MSALATSVDVAVIGAGTMGRGIAQVAAAAGHTVFLFDSAADAVTKARQAMAKDLRFLVEKGKLADDECQAVLGRVRPAGKLEDLKTVGLVIEAVVENLDVKRDLFRRLEALLGPDAILATNTSSISITAVAAGLARPERVAGLHFFNPAPRMALVEVVSGLATDPALADCLVDTARAWGKVPVRAQSTPGFIVNRVARPYYAEPLRVLGEGAATPETLDAILREGCRFPMGPFELMDFIGHDVNFAVTCSVFEATFGDRRFQPSLIQQELVLAGRLGRKSGRGFYDYASGAARPAPVSLPAHGVPAKASILGELGPMAALAERLGGEGVRLDRANGSGVLFAGTATLALTDGRTASQRAADEGTPDLVLIDLAFDYAGVTRLGVAKADQCSQAAYAEAVGLLQVCGIEVSPIDDVAGMLAMRTVCMLANEAADAVTQGIASREDIDAAMRHGTNYPLGPLDWAARLGFRRVVAVLDNLRSHYGEERYRVSPWLRRQLAKGILNHV